MRKLLLHGRWYLANLSLLMVGGCVTSTQLLDFTRTEFARLSADTIGQILSIWIQSVSPLSVQ
ncbi:MAG: hypothetical protein ABIG44_09870 [Planctomycetota bacterium]